MSPLPWLHRVALNLCYSRLSRRRPQSQPIEDSTAELLPDGRIEPAERAEQAELRQIVRDGVAGLPEKHRSVVVLYYLYGLSLQETAALLGVRLGTVKSRLHYALRALRVDLEGDRRFGGAVRGGDPRRALGRTGEVSRLPEVRSLRRLVGLRSDPCLEHRSALLALVERAPAETPGRAALDHLDRCSRCREEIAQTRLASFAVERAWSDAGSVTPSPEGWSKLKARVEGRPARRGPSASPILALALGMGITVALTLPFAPSRWSAVTIQEAAPGFVAVPAGSAPGDPVIDRSGLVQAVASDPVGEVQPISADPVSGPRRPLAAVGGIRTAVTSPNEAARRTSFAAQDPRRVAQTPRGTEASPVSAPKRLTVV